VRRQCAEFRSRVGKASLGDERFVLGEQLAERDNLALLSGKHMAEEEIDPRLLDPPLRLLLFPEWLFKHGPMLVKKFGLVFVPSAGSVEYVVANEVHCSERLSSAVERLEDHLCVVVRRKGNDDKPKVLKEDCGERHQPAPQHTLIVVCARGELLTLGDVLLGFCPKIPVSPQWLGCVRVYLAVLIEGIRVFLPDRAPV